jgi:hypothetical protein
MHPDLRLEAGAALGFGAIFWVSGLFLISWGVVLVGVLLGLIHWFSAESFQSSLVGWLVPLLCFLSGGALLYIGRHLTGVYRGWLRRVSRLLASVQPRTMLITFPQLPGSVGRVAHLHEEGRAETAEPTETVEIRSPQWKMKELGPGQVKVFREFEPDGITAMATNCGVIWGFRKTVKPAEPLK